MRGHGGEGGRAPRWRVDDGLRARVIAKLEALAESPNGRTARSARAALKLAARQGKMKGGRRRAASCARIDDPPHYTPEYRAARLDLIRRARQGDAEARRQLELSWLGMAMKAAAHDLRVSRSTVCRDLQALRDNCGLMR